MLDKHGYRPNVGIILLNQDNQVFWGKRIREQSWQFPQGGINAAESPQQAMYRELHEEIGLGPQGMSGASSVMGVHIQNCARHPSVIAVAVNVGCWSHRKGHIVWDADLNFDVKSHKEFAL